MIKRIARIENGTVVLDYDLSTLENKGRESYSIPQPIVVPNDLDVDATAKSALFKALNVKNLDELRLFAEIVGFYYQDGNDYFLPEGFENWRELATI